METARRNQRKISVERPVSVFSGLVCFFVFLFAAADFAAVFFFEVVFFAAAMRITPFLSLLQSV